MTIQGALQDNCPWSPPYKEQRSLDSAARANINGFVKTSLKCTILNGLDDAELQDIFMRAAQAYGPAVDSIEDLPQSFALKMTPIVANYLHSKIKLFIKHIIKPNYSNHDLTLAFTKECWTVEIIGYVYSKEFCELNAKIAANPQLILSKEIMNIVAEKQAVLPTVTLDWEELSRRYSFDEQRAKKIVARVNKHQICREASPLSALDMWTGQKMVVTDAEKELRARAVLLSQQERDNYEHEEQIILITQELLREGLFEDLLTQDIEKGVIEDMKNKLYSLNPQRPSTSLNALLWYHTLLYKTAKFKSWTLRTKCGETQVTPYHPLLIEATDNYVRVETVIGGEYIEYGDTEERGPWNEVNILEFLYCVLTKRDSHLASTGVVNVITSPDLELCFNTSTERDEEVDDVYKNKKNETYIVSNSDLGKLYALRPARVEKMSFAQFATEYYVDEKRGRAIIDQESGLGGDSGDMIVGGEGNAPIFMQLTNRRIMKKRTRADKPKVVPLLMHNNTLDEYGEASLFKPWRRKEELLNGLSEEEKLTCRQVRLQLFPFSVFSR